MGACQPLWNKVQRRAYSGVHAGGRRRGDIRHKLVAVQRRLDRHRSSGRTDDNRPVQHRGLLSRPELLLETPGVVAAGDGPPWHDVGSCGRRPHKTNCDRRRRGPGCFCPAPLQLRTYGHGCPPAAGSEYPCAGDRVGPCTIHAVRDFAQDCAVGRRRVRGDLASAAWNPRYPGLATGVGA